MSSTPISASQAIDLMVEFSTDEFKCDLAYLQERGFVIVSDVAGSANTVAAAPAPVAVNEALVKLIEQVRKAGRSKTTTGKPLKTSDGRPKVVLGKQENIGGYTVIINGTKAVKK